MQLWSHARGLVAEVILEGISRAGVKGTCTVMGRSAMSLDLQVWAHCCEAAQVLNGCMWQSPSLAVCTLS